ncbi:hypothetical protein GCM10022206_14250 [Streptomyces chiangmaiensis]
MPDSIYIDREGSLHSLSSCLADKVLPLVWSVRGDTVALSTAVPYSNSSNRPCPAVSLNGFEATAVTANDRSG